MWSSFKYELKDDQKPQKRGCPKPEGQNAMFLKTEDRTGTFLSDSYMRESSFRNCLSPRTSLTSVSITLPDVITTDMTSSEPSPNNTKADDFHVTSRRLISQTRQIFKWPFMNTKDENRLRKEKQLHNLMSEIDTLMTEVGLQDKKGSDIAYEIVPSHVTDPSNSSNERASSTHTVAKQQKDRLQTFRSKRRSSSEEFIDDLEKLLDICDTMKSKSTSR